MTSVLMIFEITRNYAVIVPLMVSNLVSFFIASRLSTRAANDVGGGGDIGCDYNLARCGSKNARERTERVASMLA